MKLAERAAIHAQHGDGVVCHLLLCRVRLAEALSHAVIRCTEIANAAGFLAVRLVAKMAHEARHAALAALRIADHSFNLRLFLFALRDVGIAPVAVAAAQIVGCIDQYAAVSPELFERLLKNIGGYAALLLYELAGLRFGVQAAVNLVKQFDVRVVSLEEKIVGVAVGIGVHQDGAAGFAIATCAPDLLVVGFNAAGQRGVDDGADI